MRAALEAAGLGVRYRRAWALRDCSLSVPAGRVAALVGPNGAGKTTLMHAAVGLLRPALGSVRVRGEAAFVAQDKPLYDGFTVAETLSFGRRTNSRWDGTSAADRLGRLGVPLGRKVGGLSGGQRAQVAITLALARRPDLLILDEPLANLDPLARHDVMRTVMAEVAERELTVLLSSHVVADLEETCDWLVVLNGGRLQVSGDIEDLLGEHLVLTGPADLIDEPPGGAPGEPPRGAPGEPPGGAWDRGRGLAGGVAGGPVVVSASRTGRQVSLLARGEPPRDPRWQVRRPGLDELVMGHLRGPGPAALPRLTGVNG
ncbi:ABC transporter ATP-binding protein [Nonomuraea candida]|uniref:ABC transporter ATP-binding protein n=1 Tax=Nonomuraea candida TaxID=359159 RepID=UPI0005BA8C69|nr:ABC transporter ATP-binding protein [Nonomuraea candida]